MPRNTPHLTIAEARKLARVAKAKRGGRPSKITPEKWERYLGYFGPPVKRLTKKLSTAKKGSRKRAARAA